MKPIMRILWREMKRSWVATALVVTFGVYAAPGASVPLACALFNMLLFFFTSLFYRGAFYRAHEAALVAERSGTER